jgi:eukaryotic-like serine/threonine-protein kinase
LHHRLATDGVSTPAQRLAEEAESRTWYRKSADVWTTWDARNAATPESERERRKVEHVLKKPDGSLQQARTRQLKIMTNHDRNC